MINNIQNINPQNNKQTSFSAKQQQQLLLDKRIFDTFKINAGSKTAYMPTGRLIKTKGPISGLVVGVKDTAVDIKNFAKTIKSGQSNDHALGRMNDLGLKLGGALIAAFLASKKAAPTSKAMEFIGFGAFLASMSLWPRLTIDAPIRMKNGFNIRQKYIDNEGRKKEFFQDNQYLPWDLWSSEQINKVADRMGIDKNMKDREEFTKKKMQKIALQGNTEWMLSCGLGVPLMTSMICRAAEKPLELANIDRAMKSSQKKLSKYLKTAASEEAKGFGKIKNVLNRLFGESNNIDFTNISGTPDEIRRQIIEKIDPQKVLKLAKDPDSLNLVRELPNYSNGILSDLDELLSPKYIDSIDDVAKLISEKFFEGSVDRYGDEIRKAIPLETAKKLVKNANTQDGEKFASKLLACMKKANLNISDYDDHEFIKEVSTLLQEKGLAKKSEAEALQKLTRNGKAIKQLQTKMGVLSESINSIFGQRAESIATLKYNRLGTSLLEEAGIKGDMKLLSVIKEQKNQGKAFDVLKDLFARKTANQDDYVKTILGLAEGNNQGMFAKKTSSLIANLSKKSTPSKDITKAIKSLSDDVSSIEGLPALKRLFEDGNKEGFKNFFFKSLREARLNVDATSHRALAALDFERRVSENGGAAVKKFVQDRFGTTDMVDEFIEVARKAIYSDTVSDFKSAERFIKAGKRDLWNGVVDFLFNENVSAATDDLIRRAKATGAEGLAISEDARNLFKSFGQYRQKLVDILKTEKSSKEDFLSLGKPVTEILQEVSNKTYNNKHWLKIFGIATIAVAAVTIIATFAFGKMKEKKLYEQQNGGAGNVSQ